MLYSPKPIQRIADLDELAQRIEAEHNAVAADLRSALGHAITAGELLIEAKRQVKRGQWLKWLKKISVPRRTASHYMKLAKHRKDFCDANGQLLPISVNEALDLLKHPSDRGGESWEPHNPRDPSWGVPGWGAFRDALHATIDLPKLRPPAARYIVKAARAGKTPGLTAARLREVSGLCHAYADALERDGPCGHDAPSFKAELDSIPGGNGVRSPAKPAHQRQKILVIVFNLWTAML